VTAPRVYLGIRIHTWAALFLASLALWAVLAGLAWLTVGWWTS